MPASAPTGTYRLQLRSQFGFDDAQQVLEHLDALGVSHVYLSPVLQAAPGSTHGYDVIDHDRLSEDLGGASAFHALAGEAASRGMGIVVDVVPNHMAVPTPAYLNAALWSVLKDGPTSPYAHWFDVDWAAQERAILMPVLGRRIGECVRDGEITIEEYDGEPRLRYFDHVFPIRPGTAGLPLEELLDRQFYRLAHWRVGDEELNYRRFFDIDTLVGVRVEDERVFAETHAVLLALVSEGHVQGLRIDHPDGLADPRGYVMRLYGATGAWIVVEKILEGDEALPEDWPCAGTTGYDALLRVGGLFADPEAGPVADPALRPAHRRAGRVRQRGRGGQALGRRARPAGGGAPAGRGRRRHLPRPPRAARPHPARSVGGVGRAARRVPGLPGVRRPGRAAVRAGPCRAGCRARRRPVPAAGGTARHACCPGRARARSARARRPTATTSWSGSSRPAGR